MIIYELYLIIIRKVTQESAFRGRRKALNEYVWLFPVLFILHDMEEIIGFGIWLQKNRTMLDEKYPKISRTYQDFSTEGMALAVTEE